MVLKRKQFMTVPTKGCFNKRGSFTVEAAIIFSVVFLLLVVLVYLFIVMYQYINLQSVASETANRGSAYYVKQFENYSYWPKEENPYWRFIDTKSFDKKSKLQDFALKNLFPTIFPSNITVDINNKRVYLSSQLVVCINDNYKLPAGNLLELFGFPQTFELSSQISSPLEDNAEFVRNLDMVVDIKNCLLNSDNKWIGSNSKLSEVIDRMIKKH